MCDMTMRLLSLCQNFLNTFNGFAFRLRYAVQFEQRIHHTKGCECEEAYAFAEVFVNRWIRCTYRESNRPCERCTKCQRNSSNLKN